MTELAPIECHGCGAPVPLVAAPTTRCAHCRAEVAIPAGHARLAMDLARAEADVRAADEVWKTLPSPRGPNAGRWIVAGLVSTVLGTSALWAVVGVRSGHFGITLVTIVLAPSLAAMCVAIDWLAGGAPWARLESDWSAGVDARFPEVALCRGCGAPLSVHAHAIVARCAHCRADNLVRRLRPAAYRYARAATVAGHADLAEAIAAARTIFEQRAILRPVTIVISAALVALFGWLLHDV